MCGPRGLKGEPDHLFHNNGDGTFTDVSEKAGVADKNGYYGLASRLRRRQQRRQARPARRQRLHAQLPLHQQGRRHLRRRQLRLRLSRSTRMAARPRPWASPSATTGTTACSTSSTPPSPTTTRPLYRNDGDANFTDVSYQVGHRRADHSLPRLGRRLPRLRQRRLERPPHRQRPRLSRRSISTNWGTTWTQRPLLFRNLRRQKVRSSARRRRHRPGRRLSLAAAWPSAISSTTARSTSSSTSWTAIPCCCATCLADHHHWVELKLVGGPKSPRDAVGATVYLTANGMRQRGDVISGGSFASTNDPRVHFGLGDATKIDAVEVHWPSGAKEKFSIAKVDQIVTLTEGKGTKM